MMKVYLFARVIFGLYRHFPAVLGEFVLHECIPIRTLLLEVFLEVWHEALLSEVFVQVFLEHMESNSHLLGSGSLQERRRNTLLATAS